MGEGSNVSSKTEKLKAEILDLRFNAVHEKLDESKVILSKILSQTEHTAKVISTIEKRVFVLEETNKNCRIHELAPQFESFKEKNKVVNYFSEHPKITATIAVFMLVVTSYIKPTIDTFTAFLKQYFS